MWKKLVNWIRSGHTTQTNHTHPTIEGLEGRSMFSAAPVVEYAVEAAAAVSARIAAPQAKQTALVDQQTGMRMTAPRGYTLRAANGIYTLSNGRVYAKFMLARTSQKLTAVRAEVIKNTGLKGAKLSGSKSKLIATGTLRGAKVTMHFTAVGKGLVDIVTFGNHSAKAQATKSTAPMASPLVTVAEIAALQRILNTRRGGITVLLPTNIPMRQFVAPDGGSRALVPNLPGWNFTGGGGVISGGNLTQGLVELGVPVTVGLPGFGGAVVSNPVGPDQAIATIWPEYLRLVYGANVQVTNVQFIPGTAGWLGPNFNSALFATRFVFNGRAWQGLMASGTFDMGSSIGFGYYYSYIAVPEGSNNGIGAALMNTWSSWDNSVASQRRLNQALISVLTTRVAGHPIDPRVFEEAAFKWDAYIRQQG